MSGPRTDPNWPPPISRAGDVEQRTRSLLAMFDAETFNGSGGGSYAVWMADMLDEWLERDSNCPVVLCPRRR